MFGGTLSDATAGVVDDRFMDIIPSYDEIWGTMQNQYGNETGKINAALGGFDFPVLTPGSPEFKKAMKLVLMHQHLRKVGSERDTTNLVFLQNERTGTTGRLHSVPTGGIQQVF